MICARRAERCCCWRNCLASLCSSSVIRATSGLLSKIIADMDDVSPNRILYSLSYHKAYLTPNLCETPQALRSREEYRDHWHHNVKYAKMPHKRQDNVRQGSLVKKSP